MEDFQKIYGYVYLVGSREHRWYKIGAALEPEKRIPSIQTSCPFTLETIVTKHVPKYYDFEQHLHRRYVKNWLRGEWFTFTPEELEEVKVYISKGVKHDTRTKSPQPCNESLLPVPSNLQSAGLPETGRTSNPELPTGQGAPRVDTSDGIQQFSAPKRPTTVPKRIPVDSEQYRMFWKDI